MQDIRKHARINVLIPCGIKFSNLTPADAWGHIQDLSLGGVGFHTYFPVQKGQVLFLTFTVEESYDFAHAKATILRVRESDGYYFAGVSFNELVDKNHLKEAIQSLLEKS